MNQLQKAVWIWPTHEYTRNSRANFFFEAEVDAIPSSAVAEISCETRYWLFVNGELVVFEGGLFRESSPGNGYFDTVDLAPYLKAGKNEITLHVWYYGNGGRNNHYCEKPGLLLACDALGLYSSADTLCYVDAAYYTPSSEPTSYLYGGDHTAYNATVKPFSYCPTREGAGKAVVSGQYGDAPWGIPEARPVPLLFFTDRIPCEAAREGDTYTVSLPYAMQFSPYIKVRAVGGEVLDLRSDRYAVHGGPGDTAHSYYGHRGEYVCRAGEQEFEMLDWIYGEKLICRVPDTVEVLELGYRESGYDAAITATFRCDDPAANRLFEKCVRTLKVCMRENYMDCPDRERGQWIGDVSVQAPQIAYVLDKNGLLLLRKAIFDFIRLRKGDILMGNVPGDCCCELPSQSLNAISEWGMISSYYQATGDASVLELSFEPAVAYLKLWETDADGVVIPRQGHWEWYDHLFNCDGEILNICWYYSALRFARFMAEKLGITRHNGFISTRMEAIERVFTTRYWKEKEGYFSSSCFADDRANAMAVLAGLCPPDKYPQVRYLLMSVFTCTTYMENYVLTALCEMGYKADAYRRMMCRYQPLIQNENSTLWEDFFHLGTRNHAWTGGPATILLRYFAGVQSDLTVKVPEEISPLRWVKCAFEDGEGKTVEVRIP